MLHAAFDFPRHPLAREDGERLRGAFDAPPERWLIARSANQLVTVLDQAHAAARAGAWVLGGLRYEAAGALDRALDSQIAEGALAEFAVFERAPVAWPAPPAARRRSGDWHDLQGETEACGSIERIREWIRCGDCYQVNLTTRLAAELAPGIELDELFFALHAAQPGGFSLYLRTEGSSAVASVSPELFFDWRPVPDAARAWLLAAQPMKGTAPRGRDRAEDEAAQAYLRTSEKERAENLMIVDLLRNDIGRVAELGTVRVPRLFELHALSTVWQMTSTVTAVSRPHLQLSEIFAALFPCGSVTGAPKVRAMQIICELEPEPRGWYCGALGLVQPGGIATFNVPIRTVEYRPGTDADSLRYGVGSAITLDSNAAGEVAEWRAKSRLLSRAQAPIAALETMRLENGQWLRLDAHLARLQRTARHFGLHYRASEVRSAVLDAAATHMSASWRGRLTLDATGHVDLQLLPLPDTPALVTLALAGTPINTRGPGAEFLQHKTTRREAYEAFAAAKPASAFDTLLWNEGGELTECSFGNIALLIDGQWQTPRTEAGLLPGVMRQTLLAEGRIHEARLSVDDLRRATDLAFFNSLRDWVPARLLPADENKAC